MANNVWLPKILITRLIKNGIFPLRVTKNLLLIIVCLKEELPKSLNAKHPFLLLHLNKIKVVLGAGEV